MNEDVKALLDAADHVLIAFDGPLCTVFDPTTARSTAERLRLLLDPALPRAIARTDDPFQVLRYAQTCGENTAYVVERQLATYEAESVAFGQASEGAVDAVHTLYAGGHTVTAIANQSTRTIGSFLAMHDLLGEVRRASARDDFRTTALLPDPFLLSRAVQALGTTPQRCLFIGASAQDAQAGRAAGIPVLACGAALPSRKADARIESMTELVSAVDPLSWIGR